MRRWIRPTIGFLSMALLATVLLTGCGSGDELDEADVIAPGPPATVEFRLAEDMPGEGLHPMNSEEWPMTLYVHDEIVVSNTDIVSAKVVENGEAFQVAVTLTEEGGNRFAEVTGGNMNKKIAILVDGKLVSAPVIRARIVGGRAMISGSFPEKEARRIARSLEGSSSGE